MSKKKAKEKAKKRNERRLSDEVVRTNKVRDEKVIVELKNVGDRKRNNIQRKRKQREELMISNEKNKVNKIILPYIERINNSLNGDRDLALCFILEELDGASNGGQEAKRFVRDSGVITQDYAGTMSLGNKAVEEGPQLVMNGIRMEVASEKGLGYAIKVQLSIVDRIMCLYGFGKYSGKEDLTEISVDYSIASNKELRELLTSYSDLLFKPKVFNTEKMSRLFISVSASIESPSRELQDHVQFMKAIYMSSVNVVSRDMPRHIRESVQTDLNAVSLIPLDKWLQALELIKPGFKYDADFHRVIELGRQVGDVGGRCVINVAPAIYNAFNFLFLESHDQECFLKVSRELNLDFSDTTMVSGAVSGGLNYNVYSEWVYSLIGPVKVSSRETVEEKKLKAHKTLFVLNDAPISLITELRGSNEGKLTIMTGLNGSSTIKLEGDYFDGAPEVMLALAKSIEELVKDSRLLMQGKRPVIDEITTITTPS